MEKERYDAFLHSLVAIDRDYKKGNTKKAFSDLLSINMQFIDELHNMHQLYEASSGASKKQSSPLPLGNSCYACQTPIKSAREWNYTYFFCPQCKQDRTQDGSPC